MPTGRVRPHWQQLCGELLAESQRGRPAIVRISAAGCSRTTASPTARPVLPTATDRPWQLDSWPLVISSAEWQLLSQRGRSASAAAEPDPARYLRPAHSAALRATCRRRSSSPIRPFCGPRRTSCRPGPITSRSWPSIVARSPDGQWWVVGDRTDTPAGAGYALENRIVTSRVYPELIRDCRVERLARFFRPAARQPARAGRTAPATSRAWSFSRLGHTTRPISSRSIWPATWASSWSKATT